jgi:hypothetical protein
MAYEKFGADSAAMLLIDHQVGTMSWVRSLPSGRPRVCTE